MRPHISLRTNWLVLVGFVFLLASCSPANDTGGSTDSGDGDGGSSATGLVWEVTQFGDALFDLGQALTITAGGNACLTGSTYNGKLDPSATPMGSDDVFAACYTTDLSRLWLVQFGSSGVDVPLAIASAPDETLLITGKTDGDLVGNAQGSFDVFVVKLDSSGNLIWSDQFGSNEEDIAYAVATGPEDNQGIFIGGYTRGDLTGDGYTPGFSDAFLRFYAHDVNGDGQPSNWTIELSGGDSASDGITALLPDGTGGVFVAGFTEGNLAATNHGGADVFLGRYNDGGQQLWIRQFGSDGKDLPWGMAPAGDGGFYVAGTTEGQLAEGEYQGGKDAFVARYSASGERLWIHQIGTGGDEQGWAVAAGGDGTAYLGGSTSGRLVDGAHQGLEDAFVAAFDDTGDLLWIGQKGTPGKDEIKGLGALPTGVIFTGSSDGNMGAVNQGEEDVVVGTVAPQLGTAAPR